MVDRGIYYPPVNISQDVHFVPPAPPILPQATPLPPIHATEEEDLREREREVVLTQQIRELRDQLEEQDQRESQLEAEAEERAKLRQEKLQRGKWGIVIAIVLCCVLATMFAPFIYGTDDPSLTIPNGTHVHTVISYARELFQYESCIAKIIWRGQEIALASARPLSRKLDNNLATLSQALNVTKTESRIAVRSLDEGLPGFNTSLGRCLSEVQSALATRPALSQAFNGWIPSRTGPLGGDLDSIIDICRPELSSYQARLGRHYAAFTDLKKRNGHSYDIHLLTGNEIGAVKQQHPTEDLSAWFFCSNTMKPFAQEVFPHHELLETGATALRAIAHFLFSHQAHIGQAIGILQRLPPPATECGLWQGISCKRIWKTLSALEDKLVFVGGQLRLFTPIWTEQRKAVWSEVEFRKEEKACHGP